MPIKRTILTTWLLLIALFVAACSSGDSPPAATTTPPATSTVVANAGPDQNVLVGSFVTLNGSKSTTSNGNSPLYTWSMVRPAGSAATLSETDIVNPTFTADVAGTYECELVVSDGQETSPPSKVTITATPPGTNPPPVANAGPNRSVSIGNPTSLDGSKSTDMIGDPLKYQWTFRGRPPLSKVVSLVNADKVNPSLTPDVAGQYVIELVVNDGTSDSAPARVTITASSEPPPTAKAGDDQIVLPNLLVTLDGSQSSDLGGDIPLKYQWSLFSPAGVTASLNNPTIAKPTFTPVVAGAYTAQLIVTDSTGAKSAPDTVLIIVGPRANAGPVQTVSVGATVQLNGSGSFGASLSYSWAFTAPLVPGSTAVFSPNNRDVDPTFLANVAGTYMIRLTVTDSVGRTATATTTVTAQAGPSANFSFAPAIPVVDAIVRLTNTSTPTGSSLAYTWAFTLRPPGSIAQFSPNINATNPTFIADVAGGYDVKLTARNTSTNATHSVTRRITANNVIINTPPRAEINVKTPLPANVCSTVELDGTLSSDSGGSVASYLWTLTPPNGSAAPLSSSSTTDFKADKAGTFGVRLVVTDNLGAPSPPANMNITAQPNAIGKEIYDSKGLPDMETKTFGGATGPSCKACHSAGLIHDPAPSPSFIDLSLTPSRYTFAFIKNKVTTTHILGGLVTNPANPSLDLSITSLRNFLDSTSPACP